MATKAQLHPRNRHQGFYDFTALCQASSDLIPFVQKNPKGQDTINFSDSHAVIALNQALLAHYYQLQHWLIPPGYLCPPIPGRADYIHHGADLLAASFQGKVPQGKNVQAMDIGTGASCIYPILGHCEYGWKFIASDIDPQSIKTAKFIVAANTQLKSNVKLQLQGTPENTFQGVIKKQHRFDITFCNPPFHASLEEALAGNARKRKNLANHRNAKGKQVQPKTKEAPQQALNFGGQKAELWCKGGELAFVNKMAEQSAQFAQQVLWFTSLISKSENVKPLQHTLQKLGAKDIKVVAMGQGQKISRMLAWSFHSVQQQQDWARSRW
ncbi:23S rRNA (adenine(1618)-N(6))-methyltransferase RlmF [Motilimonas pumila]|uniref:23S rRNA (adenine(1618)-N(6))-methyltransferase RlmF n=1 Tax=Motilimonas pumila TaxID=2303987 RepID=UPI001314853D|nr:23S rRNA (adenine(1618)-N(6))-methyltransferase RlmF [Motilimonas pumila]